MFAEAGEELAQAGRGGFGEDTGGDFGLVVEAGVGGDLEEGADGAGLGVVAAVDDALDSGVDDGAGAHGARFEGAVQGAAAQVPGAQSGGGLAEREDFGVRGGVLVGLATIAGAADDAAAGVDDDAADGDVAVVCGAVGLFEGEFHEGDVGIGGQHNAPWTTRGYHARARTLA